MEYRVIRYLDGVQMSASWFLTAKGATRHFASARKAIKEGWVIMHNGLELQDSKGKTLLKYEK